LPKEETEDQAIRSLLRLSPRARSPSSLRTTRSSASRPTLRSRCPRQCA